MACKLGTPTRCTSGTSDGLAISFRALVRLTRRPRGQRQPNRMHHMRRQPRGRTRASDGLPSPFAEVLPPHSPMDRRRGSSASPPPPPLLPRAASARDHPCHARGASGVLALPSRFSVGPNHEGKARYVFVASIGGWPVLLLIIDRVICVSCLPLCSGMHLSLRMGRKAPREPREPPAPPDVDELFERLFARGEQNLRQRRRLKLSRCGARGA